MFVREIDTFAGRVHGMNMARRGQSARHGGFMDEREKQR
jgi:hypothetical protein